MHESCLAGVALAAANARFVCTGSNCEPLLSRAVCVCVPTSLQERFLSVGRSVAASLWSFRYIVYEAASSESRQLVVGCRIQ